MLDDSERTKDVVRIAARSVVEAILRRPMQKAVYQPPHSITWRIPKSLKPGALHYCVVATDRSGNHNAPACATLKVR